MNSICKMLGCRYPIIQGAMSVISNPEMVAAVSEAGGFGLLATAFMGDGDVDLLHEQIRNVRQLTQRPFGANLQMMNPMSLRFAGILADAGVRAVTVSGGSPRDLMPRLKMLDMVVMAVVPTVDAAVKSAGLGVDAIIAEGQESGGLQGIRGASTMVLVPAVADAVQAPVIAAGGIADSRGYRAAFALGAQGVQVGTRFVASRECIAHDHYKRLIIEAAETGTTVFDMGRFRARIITATIDQEAGNKSEASAGREIGGGFSGPQKASVAGQGGILSAGEACGLIHRVMSVREIIAEMVA